MKEGINMFYNMQYSLNMVGMQNVVRHILAVQYEHVTQHSACYATRRMVPGVMQYCRYTKVSGQQQRYHDFMNSAGTHFTQANIYLTISIM